MANLKKGQTITLDVEGYTGSNGNAVDIQYALTNATATDDCPQTVTFDKDTAKNSLGTGTFKYTVDADGAVVVALKRNIGKTTRLVKVVITVN